MKHFIANVIYTKPFSEVEKLLNNHRNFLQEWYDKGHLLCSGPKEPRVGGIIIGKFGSMEEITEWSKQDPFVINDLAKYEITEFQPVISQDFLKVWV